MTLPMGIHLAGMSLLVPAVFAIAAPGVDRSPSASDTSRARATLTGLVVPFQTNIGQDDPRVAFAARTFAGTLFVTREGQLVHSLPGKMLDDRGRDAEPARSARKRGPGWALTETLVGARPVPRGADPSSTHVSRFAGRKPGHTAAEVPTFDRVSLGEAWPGIQVEIAARGRNVEKIFTVAPGADVRRIAVGMRGANRLELAADGTLLAHTGNGPVSFTAPIAWQEIDGLRHPVEVAYALSSHRYGFRVGSHDRAHPIVIDPFMRTTYLGGAADDGANGMAIDANGVVFIAGDTASAKFPWTFGGAQPAFQSERDGFVARLDGTLSEMVRITYVGGSGDDIASAVAVGANGSVYVSGGTRSTDFPATAGGAQAAKAPGIDFDGFVAKFSNDLTTLVQATYIGGRGFDLADAIAIDAGGGVIVAGSTASVDLPGTAGGAQPSHSTQTDSYEVFVARFNGTLTGLTQATYLGGAGADIAEGLALDANGNVFVAGYTSSMNFPGTAGGAQSTFMGTAGQDNAFVARLNGALTVLTQATFLGGDKTDRATAIALDASGNVFVAGRTQSPGFPVTAGVAQTVLAGYENAFVTKLSNDLKALIRSTFLGGNGSDIAFAIALGDNGLVYLAGLSTSLNFPGTSGGTPRASHGDGFIARLDANLQLHQATYLGGNGANYVWAVGVDHGSNVFVAGNTTSTDLYGTERTVQFYPGGGEDAFVSQLPWDNWYIATPPPQPELIPPPGQVVVVEYFHADFGHYFITAQADEIAALDAGAFAGWARTGYFFWAWPIGANLPGLVDVCRFFTVAFAPRSSHFYTANADECAAVKQNANWIYEKLAFKVALPDAALACAEFRERRLYRLYNSGMTGAPNHRYTTAPEIRALMVAHGFVPEDANTLCAPQ